MAKYELFQAKFVAFFISGCFDIRDFIINNLNTTSPAYFDVHWVNIREPFRGLYKQKENKNIALMLHHLDMKFQGRQNSGLDDVRNSAAISKKMHEEGLV